MSIELRQITGGWLAQTPHRYGTQRGEWTVVTERQPEATDGMTQNSLGVSPPRHIKRQILAKTTHGALEQDNKIVLSRGKWPLTRRRRRNWRGVRKRRILSLPDGIEAAAAAGVHVVIRPGERCEMTLLRANELGLYDLHHERHFRH